MRLVPPALRGRGHRSAVSLPLVAALVLAAVSAMHAAGLRAGAALVEITPTNLPIRTAGNLTLTVVKEINDPLHARAFVLDDGATRLAIAVVDSCMIAREDLDTAKAMASRATGISVSNMMISSTHTHTAPAVYGCHGNDAEPEYRAYIIPRIADAIVQAARTLQPARAGWGKTDLPQFVHCRRWIMQPGTAQSPNSAFTGAATNLAMMNPGFANTNKVKQTGPVDPAVTVLSVQTREGRPLALLANYSTHYASAPGNKISSDYFGEFCRIVARELKADEKTGGFVALMSNGTSGDANPIDFTKDKWVATPPVVARAVADAALQSLANIEHREEVKLASLTHHLTLGVRRPTPQEVTEAREYLATRVGARPTRNWEENYARETTLLADWPAQKEITLQAMRVGDFALAAIPCETYGITGLAVKKASPFPLTMVVGLANGYHGYLPPPDQFPLGGYTTWRARTSYLETNAEPKIRAVTGELLNTLQAADAARRSPQ
jgi:neutral ceramidase